IPHFIGVPCAHDLPSWGGLLACWRWLEIARHDDDLTLGHRSQIERRSSQRFGAAAPDAAEKAQDGIM
ncbi:MAG: hypothetical protein ACREJ0_27475, partial [Geminicoccaceae bacterium]